MSADNTTVTIDGVDYITAADAATMLDRSQLTTAILAARGRLPGARKLAGVWLIPRLAVESFDGPRRRRFPPDVAKARAVEQSRRSALSAHRAYRELAGRYRDEAAERAWQTGRLLVHYGGLNPADFAHREAS